jgi:predicted membrane metal-binding protein
MSKMVRFVISQLMSSSFWYLFLASFTIVLMMAWRAALRDDIFKDAARTIGKRY